MSDKHVHLNVLPTSGADGKIEELRRAFARDSSGGSSSPEAKSETLIDRALQDGLSEDQKIVRERVIETLQTVYDPELPVNLYDLGLIYAIDVNDEFDVHVKMTLTAPACPVAGTLPGEVERRIAKTPGVNSAKVELVWDPPWGKDRMSEAALLELGLL
jgi:FeS assembly SUF system protein